MFTNSNILGELYDTEYIIYSEESFAIAIRPYTNYWIEYPYFILYINRKNKPINSLDTLMCRISMKEPRYLHYEYETLILTKKEKEKLIDILYSQNIWEKMKSYVNDNSQYNDEDFEFYYDFKLDAELPDYTKLLTNKMVDSSVRKELLYNRDIMNLAINNIIYINSQYDDVIIYSDKKYNIIYNLNRDVFYLSDKNQNVLCKDISYNTQSYIDLSSDDEMIKLCRSMLNREVYIFTYFRPNVMEILSILHNAKYEKSNKFIVPLIKV